MAPSGARRQSRDRSTPNLSFELGDGRDLQFADGFSDGLFERFGLDGLPRNQKRAGLAAAVIRAGVVTHAHQVARV